MTVMLAVESMTHHRVVEHRDTHGWDEGKATKKHAFHGNLQEAESVTDPLATDAGGHGPSDPAPHNRTATLYAPTVVKLLPGDRVDCRGVTWTVVDTHPVLDPTGTGALDCQVAALRFVG